MDKLLEGLVALEIEGFGVVARSSGRLRNDRASQLDGLRELWPDELADLCEHVELLKLLVWVCESSTEGGCT